MGVPDLESENKLTRRDFLRLVGGAAGTAFLEAACGLGPKASADLGGTPERKVVPSPTGGNTLTAPQVVSTFEANVKATDQARDQYELNAALSELPPNLIYSSVVLAIYLKEPKNSAGLGSTEVLLF